MAVVMNSMGRSDDFGFFAGQQSRIKRARTLLSDVLLFSDDETLSYGRARSILRAHSISLPSGANTRYIMRSVAQNTNRIVLCDTDGMMLKIA